MNTEAGMVRFESGMDGRRLQEHLLAPEFQDDTLHKSIFTKKETLQRILGRGGHIALALLENQFIVGFAALDFPEPDDRWAGMGGQTVMELKAVEVVPRLRKSGIARQLLSILTSGSRLDRKIVYLVSYSWLWDNRQTGLTVPGYRHMLIRLFAGFGFEEAATNEPNICLRDENIFMVRMGNHVSQYHREAFKWLRFGLK